MLLYLICILMVSLRVVTDCNRQLLGISTEKKLATTKSTTLKSAFIMMNCNVISKRVWRLITSSHLQDIHQWAITLKLPPSYSVGLPRCLTLWDVGSTTPPEVSCGIRQDDLSSRSFKLFTSMGLARIWLLLFLPLPTDVHFKWGLGSLEGKINNFSYSWKK